MVLFTPIIVAATNDSLKKERIELITSLFQNPQWYRWQDLPAVYKNLKKNKLDTKWVSKLLMRDPRGVTLMLIKGERKIETTKHPHHQSNKFGRTEFPGGQVEYNESFLEALRRELKEEITGMDFDEIIEKNQATIYVCPTLVKKREPHFLFYVECSNMPLDVKLTATFPESLGIVFPFWPTSKKDGKLCLENLKQKQNRTLTQLIKRIKNTSKIFLISELEAKQDIYAIVEPSLSSSTDKDVSIEIVTPKTIKIIKTLPPIPEYSEVLHTQTTDSHHHSPDDSCAKKITSTCVLL